MIELFVHKDLVDNKIVETKINYTVIIKDNKVENIFNETGFSIEKNSFIFKYFSKRFNK